MTSILVLAAVSGCGSLDPEATAAKQYVSDVQPLMLENSLLAERLLTMAAMVYDDRVPSEGFTPIWNEEIVPLAEHLHVQADALEVGTEWQDLHENLVVIWNDRATAYRDMGEALVLADRTRWKKARELEGQVVKREETWFQSVNNKLAPHKLVLEQYP